MAEVIDKANSIVDERGEKAYHFFDPDTLRWWGSRVSSKLYGGRFFVTSELSFCRDDRRYTVRFACDDGTVETIGEFRKYASWSGAHAAARRLGERWVG
jgi:hypothetical protein